MIEFKSNMEVSFYRATADDIDVCRAAWVSLDHEAPEREADESRVKGLINFLY